MANDHTKCRALALTILFWIILVLARGQNEIGLNPPSMKWRQIASPTGRIIFPEGLDTLAFYIAARMQYQREHDESIVGSADQTKLVPIILQNQSTLPAGFSTPAPWRNEYYITPPQNMFLGPIRWELAMPIHEYRHTQQFHMADKGFTWVYKVLMGQTGWLFNSLMSQPLWFREGDAVVGETIFTKGGRGRLPSFHMEYRAMRLAGYHYGYEKIHYPSYQDFVPNPYRTGYYMVIKARTDFGDDIWTRTLNDAFNRKGFFYPFSRSLREHTGMTTKQLYNATVRQLDSIWNKTDRAINPTLSVQVSKPKTKKYTNYRFPHYLSDGSVVSLKSGLDLINTYYVIRNGRERRLLSPGIYTEDHSTTVVEADMMTWAESGFHERWINRDYSIIRTYNFKTGRESKITTRTRYFSPAPSKDSQKLIVSETDTRNRYSLVVLDALTGKELKRLPNPSNIFFTHMRWQDNRYVIAVILNDLGNGLVRIDTDDGSVQPLLHETSVPISRPYPFANYVLFSAGHNGINNIFALDTLDNSLYQVTRVRFGAFEPVVSADGSNLLYSEYTADGYRISETRFDITSWQRETLSEPGDIDFHKEPNDKEGSDLGELPHAPYPVRKYSALTSGLFNFYGWIPLPNIPEYGLELYTRNLMSTLVGTVGYAYNTNENTSRYYARLTYAALYPHLELSVNNGMRRSSNVLPDEKPEEFYEQDWRENSVSAGLRLPLRLTQGTHATHLNLGGFYEYYDVSSLDSADLDVTTGETNFSAVKAELLFTRLQAQARQHVKPRWGQQVSIDYNKAIDSTPKRVVASAHLFFPGLSRTHSLNFRLSHKEEEVIDTYRFADDFLMPRGYEPMPFEGLSVVSANYELPIWYPDLAAGSVFFFQRLRTNVFFDYGQGTTSNITQPLSSAGAELFLDLRFFRLFQTSIAFRFNATFDKSPAGTIPFQFLVTRFELAN